jgi:hypothetical protein
LRLPSNAFVLLRFTPRAAGRTVEFLRGRESGGSYGETDIRRHRMERRQNRSPQRQEALGLLLETLRRKHDLAAIALASEGFLVAGAGDVDLERMAAHAATSAGPTLQWEGRTVHVEHFEQWGSAVCLATVGGNVDRGVVSDLRRILSEQPALAA